MSVGMYEGEVKRQRGEIEKQQRARAEAEKKVAQAEAAALKLEQEAGRTRSPSIASSKLGRAEGKRKEAQKAREAVAKASKALAAAQKKLFEAERKLTDAQSKARTALETKQRRERNAQESKERRERERSERRRAAEDRARAAELATLRTGHAELSARLDGQPWAASPNEITVLFIAASPDGLEPLRLDREVREIQHRLRLSDYRDAVRFAYRLAVRSADLMQYLNEDRPHVVHFSGHGSQHGLAFEDSDGQTKRLDNAQLSNLIGVTSDRIRLAVFNSCESSVQAEAACDFIDAAIGMEQSIQDDTAKIFAAQFYNSLGFGHSLQQAFDQARAQVEIETGEVSGDPQLFTAPAVDPAQIHLVAPPAP